MKKTETYKKRIVENYKERDKKDDIYINNKNRYLNSIKFLEKRFDEIYEYHISRVNTISDEMIEKELILDEPVGAYWFKEQLLKP